MPIQSTVSPEITTRFREVQEILSFIKSQESAPPKPDRNEVRLLRGLFYVHLYGSFEFSLNKIVTAAAQAINSANIEHKDVSHSVGVLVLESKFKAIATANSKSQWTKRLDLIRTRVSTEIARIDDGAADSQNIWLETITQIFEIFGIQKPPMFEVTKSGYVTELVDARNKIAHGRESPAVQGTSKRSPELEMVYEAIRDEVFYVLDCFNDYIKQGNYRLR